MVSLEVVFSCLFRGLRALPLRPLPLYRTSGRWIWRGWRHPVAKYQSAYCGTKMLFGKRGNVHSLYATVASPSRTHTKLEGYRTSARSKSRFRRALTSSKVMCLPLVLPSWGKHPDPICFCQSTSGHYSLAQRSLKPQQMEQKSSHWPPISCWIWCPRSSPIGILTLFACYVGGHRRSNSSLKCCLTKSIHKLP